AYVNQFTCELHQSLDERAFRRAWETMIERHAIFRTGFAWEGLREPLQIVRKRVVLPWVRHDWRSADPATTRGRLRRFLDEDRSRGFDVRQAPLLRLSLVRLDDDRYCLVWTNHHLLCDGWSKQIVIRDVFELY